MERGQLWRSCFKLNLRMLEMNSGGITDDMAGHRSAEGVSSAAWILGHLIYSRRSLIARLGGTVADEPVWKENYARGGSGEDSHLGFATLCQAFNATDESIKAAFQGVTDWDLPTPNPFSGSDQPLEQLVAFLYMHECYHLGQIGLLRKLYGLKGAI
jgi:uncharacterized damage-inducible protein DinB